MASNLGQICPELLHLIAKAMFYNINDLPVPQLYLRLALVNKRFYLFFMSDALWEHFNVHGVERNISHHYLESKKQMSAYEAELCGGFDFDRWVHPAFSLEQFNGLSLYTRASILTDSNGQPKPYSYSHLMETQTDLRLLIHACKARSGVVYAVKELRHNRDFLMKAAAQGASVLKFTSPNFRGDRELVLKSIPCSANAFKHAADKFGDDREILLAAIRIWRKGLSHASERLRNDLEVASFAVSKDPSQLAHCSKELQGDFDFVMQVVKSDGMAIKYASADLRNNWEIASAAIKSNPRAFKYVGEEYQLGFIRDGIKNFDKGEEVACVYVEVRSSSLHKQRLPPAHSTRSHNGSHNGRTTALPTAPTTAPTTAIPSAPHTFY